MDIPRFDSASVNPRLMHSGIGDAFQEFVYQVLLPELPQLHRFPGGGKDGAIDLIDTSNGRVAVECKFVGDDKYSTIEQRWTAVKKLLEKHLSDPSGPTAGQSQYGPWYSSQDSFAQYWFCLSGILSNQEQRLTLQNLIGDFFRQLASDRPHLSHLQALKVQIVDWNDLVTRLNNQPHLIFRWFPRARPSGLVPIDEAVDVGTFRAYLTNAKLPYYSLAEHLQSVPAPSGAAILDEETLLTHFDRPEITGLVISGKGGVGKSRLTLELGWLGLRKGWSVMRVQSRLREDALDRFAERLSPDATGLLLVDYIETQSDFGELVELINVLNDSDIARLRYVAACRTNYYYQAIASSERHLPIDLTPPPGSTVQDWFAKYRQRTVEKILEKAGLPNSEKYVEVCHNIPILAVFLAYLHDAGRAEDLAELIDESEFGRWVSKRVQLTFPEKSISRELAHLIPLFPMDDSAASVLPASVYRPIFDRLATDGWVEKVPASVPEATDTWMTAHDVLADQILLSYVRSIPNTTENFVAELFARAGELQCVRSALVSLQRVSDTAPLNTINWRKVISNAISSNQEGWRDVRDLLLRTTLLSAPDYLSLLRTHEQFWTNAETDLSFQKSLAWIARWLLTHPDDRAITSEDRDVLIAWIAKAAPLADRSNFIITWGLRLAPEIINKTAYAWIASRPTLFQTHYLMVAWLDCGFPPNDIATFVRQWCQRFSQSFHLTFVVRAWLDAGGDKELLREPIRDWLVENRRTAEAEFVYKAWLDAGGEKELVREAIRDWLVEHWRTAEAQFVYKAWLDADGEKELVREAMRDWLVDYGRTLEASHVYEPWLNTGGEKELVREAIRDWLGEHWRTAEAQFVYKAWLDSGGEKELVREAIRTWLVDYRRTIGAQFVYKAWLNSGGENDLVREAIRHWLVEHRRHAEAQFVYKAWLDAGGEKELVREAIRGWLVDHRRNDEAQFVYDAWLNAGGEIELVREAIRDWLVEHWRHAEAEFVYKAWLDAGGEKELVREAIRNWLVEHRRNTEAQFVYDAWLDAGGEKELVQEAIKDWLVDHGNSAEASHVYKAWLDADGEKAIVRDAIRDWLLLHAEDSDADHIFKSWLESGGERDLVWEAATAWLSQHRQEESAVYVTKFIAKQPNLTLDTIRDVLTWCGTFSTNEDAIWRLSQLRDNLLVPEIAADLLSASEVVFRHLLGTAPRLDPGTRGRIAAVLFSLISSREMQYDPFRERVDALFVAWLKHPQSFGRIPKPFLSIQRVSFPSRLADLLAAGTINAETDKEPVRRFNEWVDEWDVETKKNVRPVFEELRNKFPITGVWEIVRFDDPVDE